MLLAGRHPEALDPHLCGFVMTLAGLQKGGTEDLRSGNITAMPQGIGINRQDVKIGIGGKKITLGLQTFQVVVLRQNADDVLQAMPGGHGGHVADELCKTSSAFCLSTT